MCLKRTLVRVQNGVQYIICAPDRSRQIGVPRQPDHGRRQTGMLRVLVEPAGGSVEQGVATQRNRFTTQNNGLWVEGGPDVLQQHAQRAAGVGERGACSRVAPAHAGAQSVMVDAVCAQTPSRSGDRLQPYVGLGATKPPAGSACAIDHERGVADFTGRAGSAGEQRFVQDNASPPQAAAHINVAPTDIMRRFNSVNKQMQIPMRFTHFLRTVLEHGMRYAAR